jgi:hypothetical protein
VTVAGLFLCRSTPAGFNAGRFRPSRAVYFRRVPLRIFPPERFANAANALRARICAAVGFLDFVRFAAAFRAGLRVFFVVRFFFMVS